MLIVLGSVDFPPVIGADVSFNLPSGAKRKLLIPSPLNCSNVFSLGLTTSVIGVPSINSGLIFVLSGKSFALYCNDDVNLSKLILSTIFVSPAKAFGLLTLSNIDFCSSFFFAY